MIQTIITPLAMDTFGLQGAVSKIFAAFRAAALSASEVYVPTMLVIVTFIFIIRLAKQSYTIMSDEQTAGFGGIRLWDILRPLTLVFILQSCAFWLGLFDGAVTSVTDAVTDEVVKHMVHTSVGEEIRKFEYAGKTYDLSNNDDALSLAGVISEPMQEAATAKLKSYEGYMKEKYGYYALGSSFWSDEDLAEYNRLMQEAKDARNFRDDFEELLKECVDCQVELKKPKSWGAALATWLFDKVVAVVIAMSDIILCVFAVFFPLVVTLSIFDVWRDALRKWISGYIQVSLWKVTVSVIAWICINARAVSLKWMANHNIDLTGAVTKGVADPSQYVNSGTWLGIAAAVAFAGVLCILAVPSITSAAISLASTPKAVEDMSTSAVASPITAAKGAAKGAGFLAGLKK